MKNRLDRSAGRGDQDGLDIQIRRNFTMQTKYINRNQEGQM